MMTSSGSGSYRVGGGSLSSSNLSPLAPPFKVDKSLMKPNSTNPTSNYSDVHVPYYGACFDPAPGQFWNSTSSSSSVPKCVATESVVTNTNCSSSANMYGYQDSQPSTLPSSVYFGSTNGVSGYDPFTYEPFPKSISSNADEAAKPYYPTYAPPPPQKDGYLSLGVGSGPGYDLLSYSGSSHLSGFASAQVDHPQAVPGDGGYKSKWGYNWTGLNESEHEKWTDYAKGFASKDLNIPNLSSNKSPLFVEAGNKSQPFADANVYPFVDGGCRNHLFGDVSNKSHLNQGTYVSQDQGLHGQASSVKDNCFDIFGGSYSLGNLGIDQQDYKSPSKCSRMQTSTSTSISVSREIPHLQEPVLESVTSFCGSQKGNGSSPDDLFNRASFYMFGCASTASTFPTMTNLPYCGSSSSMESAPSVVKDTPKGMDAVNQINTAMGLDSSYQMESQPQMPHNMNSQSSIRIRRPASSSRTASSCNIGKFADHRLDDKVVYEQILSSPQLPHQLGLDGLNMEASDAEAVHSVEKHSGGSEGHNPAEDSPCWRGASSSRFSPFEHTESLASDGLLNKLDTCRSFSSQDVQNRSLPLNTSDSKDLSGKLKKVTSVEGPSAESEDCGSAYPKYRSFDLNAGDDIQLAEDCHASTVDCSMMNKSNTDADRKSSSAEHPSNEQEISSASKICGASLSERRGNDTPVVADSGSPLNHSNSLSENEASVKLISENSNSKVDINVLLRTMMNLSEIFRCYCFNNRGEIEKKHSVSIKEIINNLNASMLMVIGETVPTTLFSFPDSFPDSFTQKEFPVVQMVNDAEALAASLKLGGTAENLDKVSFEDDRIPFGDVNITDAVKKLLSENLQEEMDQQKLLYKNLWLEAEASLCVMTAKARFMRMKTEMERAHDGAKDKDSPSSSDVSANTQRVVELATEAKNSQPLIEFLRPPAMSQENPIEESSIPNPQVTCLDFAENERLRPNETYFPSLYVSSHSRPDVSGNVSNDPLTNIHVNDVEACVMARYQILQNRVGCSDSLNYEGKQSSGEHKCPISSYESINGFQASGTSTKSHDLETSVFGGYQILKCRDDIADDHLDDEGQQLPGEENYLPDIDSLSPDKTFQDSEMSNSLGVTDGCEASVMARFRILQSRIDHLNPMISGSAPGQQTSTVVVEDEPGEMGEFRQKPNFKITAFGPYPELTEDEDVNILNIGPNEQTFAPIVMTNKLNSVIFEGWYDNDCSSSDWEHISRVVV